MGKRTTSGRRASSPRSKGNALSTRVKRACAAVRGALGEVNWLLYQGVVLARVMGFGLRWIWMFVRCICFGCVMLNGFAKVAWYHLTAPYVMKRVRYSDAYVPITRVSLQDAGRRRQHVREPGDVPGSSSESELENEFETSTMTGITDASPGRTTSAASLDLNGGDEDDGNASLIAGPDGVPAGYGPNNRAVLDIYLPVPVESLVGPLATVSLAEATPEPESVATDSAASTPQHKHRRLSSDASKSKGKPTGRPRSWTPPPSQARRRKNRHESKTVGLRHAPEVVVPPTVVPPPGLTPEDTAVKFPVLVLVTGGAWIVGVQYWMCMMARVMSACGFVVITPDYRNFPAAAIPDMVDDVDAAIEWTIRNTSRFNGDPDRIYVLGQSAGAHLVFMSLLRQVNALRRIAGEDPSSDGVAAAAAAAAAAALGGAEAGDGAAESTASLRYHPRKEIRAFFGLSGMYDLDTMADYLDTRGLYKGVLEMICNGDRRGCSALAQLIDADSQALAKFLPAQLIFAHGNSDSSAPHSESEHMVSALQQHFGQVVTAAAEQYGADFVRFAAHIVPHVKLHTLAGATHTSPMVEDFLAGRSEIAAIILAVAKSDFESDAAKRSPPQDGESSQRSNPHRTPRGVPQAAPLPPEILDTHLSFANSVSFTGATIAALQAALAQQDRQAAPGGEAVKHRRAPVVKFSPLIARWQANLAGFVSAF